MNEYTTRLRAAERRLARIPLKGRTADDWAAAYRLLQAAAVAVKLDDLDAAGERLTKAETLLDEITAARKFPR